MLETIIIIVLIGGDLRDPKGPQNEFMFIQSPIQMHSTILLWLSGVSFYVQNATMLYG